MFWIQAGSKLTKVKLIVVKTANPSVRAQVVPPASIALGSVCHLASIICLITHLKQKRVHRLPDPTHLRALSLSVSFSQWLHFVLSDLGNGWTPRGSVAHEETESCCRADLWLGWKHVDRRRGICPISSYLLCQRLSPVVSQ